MRLWYYVARRLVLVIPTFFGLTLIVFALAHFGGDQRLVATYVNVHSSVPVPLQEQQVELRLHLNESIVEQYYYWLVAFIEGSWGYTQTPIYSGSVTSAIELYFPNTLILAVLASVVTAAIGIPLGVWSAIRKDKFADHLTRVAAFAAYSVPAYWLGLILIIVFGSSQICPCLNHLPLGGTVDITLLGNAPWFVGGISNPTHVLIIDALIHWRLDILANGLQHLVLPVVTLALGSMAGILRITRSSMLDVLDEDYIRTARAKGLTQKQIINQHARRNALIPVTTLLGYTVAALLGGVVLIETVFDYPGIGYWATQALLNADLGGIMGATAIFGLTFIVANLAIDLTYAFLDPRIRY